MTTIADLQPLANVTNLSDVATFANNITGGVLLFGFSIVFFIILLLAFKRFAFNKGFMAASWIMFIITGILWFGGFMGVIWPIFYLIMGLGGIVWVWMEG